jgi:hypothetical protein
VFQSWAVTLGSLAACAAPQPVSAEPLRARSGSYELQVVVDGAPAPTYVHAGETYVLGQQGSRYRLRIVNRSARRVEAVVSVDGLDVTDGQAGDFAHKRGYLVPAWGQVELDGWRLSERQAAVFRFAAIEDSYAAKTGRPRNVGVIGVAIFPERSVQPKAMPVQVPAPRLERHGPATRGRAPTARR